MKISSHLLSFMKWACAVWMLLMLAGVSVHAAVLFSDGFTNSWLAYPWASSGAPSYNITVTSNHFPHSGKYHVTLDTKVPGSYARNELTLSVYMGGHTNRCLSFWAKRFNDEPHPPLSNPFASGENCDGVAISTNGLTWYEVQSLRDIPTNYTYFQVNLEAAFSAWGLYPKSELLLRFTQYDNYPIPGDGIAIDDVQLTGQRVVMFGWAPIPPQRLNVPFPVTLTALDMDSEVVTNFVDQVRLHSYLTNFIFSPTNTGNFTNGVWSGLVTVHASPPDSSVWLSAFCEIPPNDYASGSSDSFRVDKENDLLVRTWTTQWRADITRELTFIIAVTNTGPDQATGVRVSDFLPPDAEFVSATPSQGSCRLQDGVVACELGEIPAGTNATVALVIIPQSFATLTNTAVVFRNEVDPEPANNTATASIPVGNSSRLRVTPETGLISSGFVQGPFSPNRQVFTVSNAGNLDLKWSLTKAASWCTVSLISNTLAPGASTNVVVSLNTAASNLTAGTYSDFLRFSNSWGPGSTTRMVEVSLRDNIPPVAESQSLLVEEDSSLRISLGGTDMDGQPLLASLQTLPARGTLFTTTDGLTRGSVISKVPTTISNNLLFFVPYRNEYGSNYASFAFRLSDGKTNSSDAVVVVDVQNVPDPPHAVADRAGTLPGVPTLPFDVLANDFDDDGESVRLDSFTQPSKGSLIQTNGGSFVYTPGPAFAQGEDQFTYTICDLAGNSSTGTVALHVGYLRGPWPMAGHDASHTCYFPGRLGGRSFVPAWSMAFTNLGRLNSPATADGVAYLAAYDYDSTAGHHSQLIALNLHTGATSWRQEFGNSTYAYRPAYEGGRLFLKLREGTSALVSFDALTGQRIWTTPMTNDWDEGLGPTVFENSLWYLSTWSDNRLWGFDTDGVVRFSNSIPTSASGGAGGVSHYRGKVYTWFNDTIAALDPVTGTISWQNPSVARDYRLGGRYAFAAMDEGRAFLLASASLHAVDLNSHSLVWSVTNLNLAASPAVNRGVVYCLSTNRVLAFRSSDGTLLREYGPVQDSGLVVYNPSTLIVTDDALFASFLTNTYVFSLDTGGLLQSIPHAGQIELTDRYLLIADNASKLRAYVVPFSDDLMLRTTAGTAPVWNPATQVFTITNTGPSTATQIRFTNDPPANAILVGGNASQGSCSVFSNQLICELGDLAGQQSATIQVTLIPTDLQAVVSTGRVWRAESDGNPANNLALAQTSVALPLLTVLSNSFVEGNSGASTGQIEVLLSTTNNLPVTASYNFYSGTALQNTDFIGGSGTLTFPPGTTRQFIPVAILGDSHYESQETFTVRVTPSSNAAPGSVDAVCAILNDDPPPVAFITDTTVTEGNLGFKEALFTVTLSPTGIVQHTIDYQTVDLTALSGSDYFAQSGVLTFPPGSSAQTIRVPILGDVLPESDETFQVRLVSGNNTTFSRDTGLCTIFDDDQRPRQLQSFDWGIIPSPQIAGRAFPAQILARDSYGNLAQYFSGPVQLTGFTPDSDLYLGTGTNYLPGPFLVQYLTVRHQFVYLRSELGRSRSIRGLAIKMAAAPLIPLDNWTIRLKHTTTNFFGSSAGFDVDGWTTVYQAPSLLLSTGWVEFVFASPFVYNSNYNLMVDFSHFGRAASSAARAEHTFFEQARGLWTYDYHQAADPKLWQSASVVNDRVNLRLLSDDIPGIQPAVVRFTNGIWSGPITVPEPGNLIALRANDTNGHWSISHPFAVLLTNVLSLALTTTNLAVVGEPLTYTLVVSNAGPAMATGITLTSLLSSPCEFVSLSAGECTTQDSQRVVCDLGHLGPGATVTAALVLKPLSPGTLTNEATLTRTETEYGMANNSAVLTTEVRPVYVFINDIAVSEGEYEYSVFFTVALNRPSTKIVTVQYRTADGTATASPGQDYASTQGTVSFYPGSTNQSISVRIYGDFYDQAGDEPDETFFVQLSNVTNGVIAKAQGTCTITNDDWSFLTIDNASVGEGNDGTTNAIFTVRLNPPTWRTVTVNYSTLAGSATEGEDFLPTNGIITFPPGSTAQTVNVTILGDTLLESNETFGVRLSQATGARLYDPEGTGTILDDELPTVSVGNSAVTESSSSVSVGIALTLSKAYPQPVTLEYFTQSGTALSDVDFSAKSGKVTFSPGYTSLYISVPIRDDILSEGEEKFYVFITNAENAFIANNKGTVTIRDDDGQPRLIPSYQVRIDDQQGNHNSLADPGEIIRLYNAWKSTAPAGADGARGTLCCLTPGVTLLQAEAEYPHIPAGGSATNGTPYVFHISKSIPCSSYLRFEQVVQHQAQSYTNQFTVALNGRAPWELETVDTSDVGVGCSIAVDRAGRCHLSYFDVPSQALKYALRTNGVWGTSFVVQLAGDFGETSLALNTNEQPCIAFHAEAGPFGMALWTGSNWLIETISTAGDGVRPSLAVDSSGQMHLSHYDGIQHALKYSRRDATGWRTETVAAQGDAGAFHSLALWGALPRIAYTADNGRSLKYAVSDGSTWNTETVNTNSAGFASWPSLALDSFGYPHIVYNDPAGEKLTYSMFNGISWTNQPSFYQGSLSSLKLDAQDRPHIACVRIEPTDYYGTYGVLTYKPPSADPWERDFVAWQTNAASLSVSLALDSFGRPYIAYAPGVSNALRLAKSDGCRVFNNPPVAFNDWLAVPAGSTTNFTLQAFDIDGDPLSWRIARGPGQGTLWLTTNSGQATFTAPTNFEGSATAGVVVSDGSVTSSEATILFDIFPDQDADGMSDTWELNHGLSSHDASDAAGDLDGDGFNNLSEFRARTEPNNPLSALRITSVLRSAQSVQVEFSTVPGRTYRLLRAASLPNAPWTAVGSPIAGTGAPVQLVDDLPLPGSVSFYKIQVLP